MHKFCFGTGFFLPRSRPHQALRSLLETVWEHESEPRFAQITRTERVTGYCAALTECLGRALDGR